MIEYALALAAALQAPAKPPLIVVAPPSGAVVDPFAGMSAAGRAIVQAEMPLEAQRQRDRQARYDAAMAKLKSALAATPIDLAAVQTALADRDRILDENRRAQSAAAVALMGRLSESDRRVVGQAIARSPGTN